MTKDEALKLALEWFEKDGEPDHHPVVTAIREALAQPEQEPVAWVECDGELVWNNREAAIGRNLYTTPPHRKPLTEKEIDQITEQLDETTIGWSTHEFARAIEAAHGIKE